MIDPPGKAHAMLQSASTLASTLALHRFGHMG
jgi:hypothetical protein